MTKYSIKNICLGIGIGLVIASVANLSTTSRALTVDDIKREAAKHNLLVMDAKDMIQKQPDENKQVPPSQEVEPSKETPENAEESIQEKEIKIEIKSGTTSEKIAELLVSNNLVKNNGVFLDRLSELKKENKIQIGIFTIPSGASLDKIIEIITSSPK